MERNRKIKCIHILTEEDVKAVNERDAKAKEKYASYDCPWCEKFIWWNEPHSHRVGEKVRG